MGFEMREVFMKRTMALTLAMLFVLVFTVHSAVAEGPPGEKKEGKEHKGDGAKEGRTGDCPKYSFKFSGYFKGDFAYDDARVSPGNYAIKVMPGENDATSITARETRLGIDFLWKEEGYRTDAKLEFDFYGLGAKPASLSSMENKAAPMLRHAFLKISRGHWSLLAGQTSDVISPLVPKTVNYTVAWGQGNIGYRRPQFRLTGWMNVGEKAKVTCAVAATRNLGADLDGDGSDDGADSAIPGVQGRIGFAAKLGEGGSAALGVSGHYRVEEYNSTVQALEDAAGETETESWSLNVDAKVVVNEYVALSGEFFTGQNLGGYLGGVLQSINPYTHVEIGAMGGWGMVHLKPHARIGLNVGYSFDDPEGEDFALPEDQLDFFINKNETVMGNIFYSITSTVQAMLEVSYLRTTYVSMDGAEKFDETEYEAMRVQFALKAAIK